MDESGDESQRSGSEEEPLVPDIIDDEFYENLLIKIGEASISMELNQMLIPEILGNQTGSSKK